MNDNIVIVTAFFDIGRGNLSSKALQRSNDVYLHYFEHWARLKNMLYVYTSTEFADSIINIRDNFGLKNKTKVITINNVYDIEPEIYQKMKKISNLESFKNFRYYYNALSNTANYDYIMMLKYYFMYDVARNNICEKSIVWLDFGFDHGGTLFPNSQDFSYQWKYNFTDKIHLWALYNPDTTNSIDMLQMQKDCLMGALICVSNKFAMELWKLIKEAMNALIMLDCIDDDQQLLLMAYRIKPEIFEIHISDWFLPLKQYGGEHLTTNNKTATRPSLVLKLKNILGWRNKNVRDFLNRTASRCQ